MFLTSSGIKTKNQEIPVDDIGDIEVLCWTSKRQQNLLACGDTPLVGGLITGGAEVSTTNL